ncbi:MAG: hypothetical protein JWN14_2194 [Chthonomonadales bacterium]|nr:hypothetical protein [Chthonomonadales bacterium]
METLRIALKLLQEADNYLTDGDEIDEIAEEGAPDLAAWAQQVRGLLEQHSELVTDPDH